MPEAGSPCRSARFSLGRTRNRNWSGSTRQRSIDLYLHDVMNEWLYFASCQRAIHVREKLRVVEAGEALRRAIFRNVHESWGGELLVDEFVARRLRSPHHSRARWFAGLIAGEPVSSLGWFPLKLSVCGRLLNAVGVGAVHTVPQWRGRGFASQLLEHVLAQARQEEIAVALLFTEIDPAFYERFGFRCCNARVHTAVVNRPVKLPQQFLFEPIHPQRHLAWIKRVHERFHSTLQLHIHRDSDYWHYWMQRWPVPKWFLLRHKASGQRAGYARLRARERTLLVEEYGVDPDAAAAEPALFAHLAELARQARCEAVSGWLPPRPGLERWFHAEPRRSCIPMLAPLQTDIDAKPLRQSCHFWMSEYF